LHEETKRVWSDIIEVVALSLAFDEGAIERSIQDGTIVGNVFFINPSALGIIRAVCVSRLTNLCGP
jgi:hypothetical protein